MKSVVLSLQDKKAPKYERIYTAFLLALKDGVLKPGDKISSTRELAKTYKCHRLTVMNALQSLVSEGWLESREKSYYYVSDKAPITTSLKSKPTQKKSAQFRLVKEANEILIEERTRHKIEFWGGQPDLRLFPKEEFRKVLSDAIKFAKPDLLSYGKIEGLDVFKVQVEEYFRRTRGIVDRDYIVTNGSQEGIYLIAQAFLKPGDAVAVEGKGYPPVWRILENMGVKIVPISVDQEGLVTDELESSIRKTKIKMIYTTPLHQYPTTVTLSPRRRQELIQIAEKYQIPILEDDYDHEFHYLSPPPAPLATQTPYAIYIASFSKIVFPGSRLGVIACHENLIDVLATQKFLLTRQTDSLNQLALARWMKEGGFEKHLRRTTRTYEKRFFLMAEIFNKLAEEHNISWQQPNGGMCYWLNVNRNSKKIAEEASKKGVFFQNEKTMSYDGKEGTHLRIGFACVNESEIQEGLSVLSNILKKK